MKKILARQVPTLLWCWVALCSLSPAAELKQNTVDAFNRYLKATESRFTNELRPGGAFFYVDTLSPAERNTAYAQLRQGGIFVERLETKLNGKSFDVPDGMIHHWVGLVFIHGATLAGTLPVLKDYDHRVQLFKPDVLASRILWRQGDDYKIFLRLHQKQFTTVDFNTEYNVDWGQVDPSKVWSNSSSTRITEVKDAAQPDGPEWPPGQGHGYLWRLNTYWRFQEKDGGVYLQCEVISLTRDIPTGLGWLLRPLVTSIPQQSLNHALNQTRDVVLQQGGQNGRH